MDRKYWVPALEKADGIVSLIAQKPGQLKLSDLSKMLKISKSSMFSLLQTMETLDWIHRDATDTYTVGIHFGVMGNAYFSQYDLIGAFHKEAKVYMKMLNESLQLAKLEGSDVFYLAKEAASSPIQMVSGPGFRMPAYATGLGKVLLSKLSDQEIDWLYSEELLQSFTPYTLRTKKELVRQLQDIKGNGYALDLQEGVMGFNCIAAPVYRSDGEIEAAISFSIPLHHWEEKREKALQVILVFAKKLSYIFK